MYWWRRRLVCPDGTTVVALSLDEREPSRAISLAIAMTAASEDVMQLYPVGSARQKLLAHLASLHLATRQRVEEDRVAVLAARARGEHKADQLLTERRSQARIYATLNRIAAAEGEDIENPLAAIRKHGPHDLTEFEIAKILHRLERGYAREAYRPGSSVANVPDLTMLDGALIEEGALGENSVRSMCAGLATRRAEIESEAERLYTRALNAPEQPVAKGEPRISFDACEKAWMRPSCQMADRIARDDIRIAVTDQASADSQTCSAQALVLPPVVTVTVTELPRSGSRPVPAGSEVIDPDPPAQSAITIDQLVEDLIGTSTWGAKTAAQVRGVAHLFQRMAKSQLTSALNELNFVEYRQLLTRLPRHYGKSPRDFELDLDEVIETARRDKKPTGLSKQTINRHMTQIGAIYAFGSLRKLCQDWSKLIESRRPRISKKEKLKKPAFSDQEATQLLASPEWSPRAVLPEASLYWGVLLAAFTGARQAEIAGLKLADIDTDAVIIHIRENANRDVKTEAGERKVPIHSELLRLGFLRYVKTLKCKLKGDADLFPDLRARGAKTSHGALLAKSFDKVMFKSGVKKANPKLSFHSWRHAVNTKMAKVSDAIREQVVGHEGKTINTSVYMHNIAMPTLKEAIELVTWDTSHLMPLRWHLWEPPSPAAPRGPRQKRPAAIR
ncbi:MAG: hypothetical protein CTY25_07160 [Methylobacterium sp.]|nr:MAG: hypothetical protein CTY25_07160 [Methylobacterium sp.]